MIHEWMAVVRVDKPFLLRGGWRRGTYVRRGPKNVQTSGEGAHRICASGSRKAAGCRRRKLVCLENHHASLHFCNRLVLLIIPLTCVVTLHD